MKEEIEWFRPEDKLPEIKHQGLYSDSLFLQVHDRNDFTCFIEGSFVCVAEKFRAFTSGTNDVVFKMSEQGDFLALKHTIYKKIIAWAEMPKGVL